MTEFFFLSWFFGEVDIHVGVWNSIWPTNCWDVRHVVADVAYALLPIPNVFRFFRWQPIKSPSQIKYIRVLALRWAQLLLHYFSKPNNLIGIVIGDTQEIWWYIICFVVWFIKYASQLTMGLFQWGAVYNISGYVKRKFIERTVNCVWLWWLWRLPRYGVQ